MKTEISNDTLFHTKIITQAQQYCMLENMTLFLSVFSHLNVPSRALNFTVKEHHV